MNLSRREFSSVMTAELAFGVDDSACMKQTNHYQNRSFSRKYSLGYRPKKYLKTGKKCSKRAFSRAKNLESAKKRINLGIKSGQNGLFMSASSYEICSVKNSGPSCPSFKTYLPIADNAIYLGVEPFFVGICRCCHQSWSFGDRKQLPSTHTKTYDKAAANKDFLRVIA